MSHRYNSHCNCESCRESDDAYEANRDWIEAQKNKEYEKLAESQLWDSMTSLPHEKGWRR